MVSSKRLPLIKVVNAQKSAKSKKSIKTKNVEKSHKQKKEKLEKKKVLEIINDEKIVTKTKIKFIMPSKYVTDNIVLSCLNALEQVAANVEKKNKIFDDEQQIFLEITCIKIQISKGNIKFVVPYSTAASTGEVCLITPDLKKGKKVDHEPTIEYWEEVLRKAEVSSVKTILPMRQLKVEYDQFELKRRLLTQHDFIMVDTRVLNHVSHLLGKMFFKKHNMLIPVRLDEKSKDVKKCIDVGLRTTMLRLSEGANAVILIGHTGMERNKLKENILSLINQLREKYPGGEANIRSLALKLPFAMPLPFYITLRSSNTVANPPKIRKVKPKNFKDVEDDLSTMVDTTVVVTPGGTVHVKRHARESKNDEEDEEQVDEN